MIRTGKREIAGRPGILFKRRNGGSLGSTREARPRAVPCWHFGPPKNPVCQALEAKFGLWITLLLTPLSG